ncbi:hypothetical protein ACMD2_22697 [Ananas comosus]|uniref:Uncharacterized protein n=1 Tax=Ananas comosus TaxID=4615 RepID=A0A199UYS3_ANACO|nr:hypothetical protein ACMD2_22697 [Ananas comosus]
MTGGMPHTLSSLDPVKRSRLTSLN